MPRRRHARYLVPLIGVVLLTFAVNARAQDSTKVSPLAPGAWALQFRVGEDFTLSSFKGALLSVKHHSSERTALRLGISTRLNFQEAQFGLDSGIEGEMDQDSQSITVTMQRLQYMASRRRFSPFWGLGPTVGWERSKARREMSQVEGPSVESERSVNSWTAGLTGNFGIEWCPSPNVGLHAEYGVFGGYTHGRDEITTDPDTDAEPASQFSETNSWRVSGEGALLGLSVYF